MTPVGHFMCASAVAGNVGLTSEKETWCCFAYYVLFLVVFLILSLILVPGKWGMYIHDWFGNVALIFFLFFWGRAADERKRCFVSLLIGTQILSGFTHIFDVLAFKSLGYVPTGMWRPHNILHTPLAAIVIPLMALPLVSYLMKGLSYKKAYFYLSLGYFLHIFADTITYNYQIYPLWPLSSFHVALVDFFQRPDVVSSQFLGAPLYIFEGSTKMNVDGFIVYKSEVLINFLLIALFSIRVFSRRLFRTGL